jgi:hypothetical protein
MNTQQLSFPLAGRDAAVLTLSRPLAPDELGALEHSVSAELRHLQRALRSPAADPAQIEYASWLRQLGAARQ